MHEALAVVFFIALSVLSIGVAMLPAIIAVVRGNHPSPIGVFLLTLLLGWTGIGWIVALVWSFSSKQETQVIIQNGAALRGVTCPGCDSENVAKLPDGSHICGNCGRRG